jgi:hypothetical protein
MAHTPLKMTIAEARAEVNHAWSSSYSPERNALAIEMIRDRPLGYRIGHLVARLFFRGIYFPQMGKRAWIKVIAQNRGTIYELVKEGASTYRAARRRRGSAQVVMRVP